MTVRNRYNTPELTSKHIYNNKDTFEDEIIQPQKPSKAYFGATVPNSITYYPHPFMLLLKPNKQS